MATCQLHHKQRQAHLSGIQNKITTLIKKFEAIRIGMRKNRKRKVTASAQRQLKSESPVDDIMKGAKTFYKEMDRAVKRALASVRLPD